MGSVRGIDVGLAALAIATFGACGDNTAPNTADSGVGDGRKGSGGCWPTAPTTPKGTVVLGTGRDGFEAMPDMLPIEFGIQDGYDLIANVHMTGLDTGNPEDLLDPSNTRTRIRAYFVDSGLPLNYYSQCPFRIGYVPSPGGGFELQSPAAAVVFELCWRSGNLLGHQVRIELDVIDDTGGYAHDEKIVTLSAPLSQYPIEPNAPGCDHGLPPVAGVESKAPLGAAPE